MTVRLVVTTRVQVFDGDGRELMAVAGAYDRQAPARWARSGISCGIALAAQDVRSQLGLALWAAGLDPDRPSPTSPEE